MLKMDWMWNVFLPLLFYGNNINSMQCKRAFFGMKIIRFCRNFFLPSPIFFFSAAIWNKTFLLSSLSSSALSFMLMEIVCLSDREWGERRQRKKDIGLTSIYFYVKLYTFYTPSPPDPIRAAMLTSVFIVNTYWLWHNMEIVLPANYSIVASCALNLKDYLLSQQTQVAPHNRMDIKFYYHIGSTYRQHKI